MTRLLTDLNLAKAKMKDKQNNFRYTIGNYKFNQSGKVLYKQ